MKAPSSQDGQKNGMLNKVFDSCDKEESSRPHLRVYVSVRSVVESVYEDSNGRVLKELIGDA
jgi:hypothetical protein